MLTSKLPIVRDGWVYIIPLIGVGIILLSLGYQATALFCLASGAFVAFFFRNPEREIPSDPKAIVSPADGKVADICQTSHPELTGPQVRVGIFLSIFNVHVNRTPLAGVVKAVEYHKGSFKAAFSPEASTANEQNCIVISGETDASKPLSAVVCQIAGLLARRIVCWTHKGDTLQRGDRIGLIKFGSRVELYLPAQMVDVQVKVGDRVKGGRSIVALTKKD